MAYPKIPPFYLETWTLLRRSASLLKVRSMDIFWSLEMSNPFKSRDRAAAIKKKTLDAQFHNWWMLFRNSFSIVDFQNMWRIIKITDQSHCAVFVIPSIKFSQIKNHCLGLHSMEKRHSRTRTSDFVANEAYFIALNLVRLFAPIWRKLRPIQKIFIFYIRYSQHVK